MNKDDQERLKRLEDAKKAKGTWQAIGFFIILTSMIWMMI